MGTGLTLVALACGALWVAFAAHCLLSRRVVALPLLGGRAGTRAFWLLAFASFDPLALVLYALLGFSRRERTEGQAVLAIAAVLLLFAWSPTELLLRSQRPVTFQRAAPGEPMHADGNGGLFPRVALTASSGQPSRQGSTWRGGNSPSRVHCRDVVVLARSPHPIVHHAALAAQEEIARIDFVQRVRYFPAGRSPEHGQKTPDLVLAIDLGEARVWRLPFATSATAVLDVTTSMTPRTRRPYRDPLAFMDRVWHGLEGPVKYHGLLLGIESPSSRHSTLGRKMGALVGQELRRILEETAREYGVLDELPEVLNAPYRDAAVPAALRDRPASISSSPRGPRSATT